MNKFRFNGITPSAFYFGDRKVARIWLGTDDPENPQLVYAPDTSDWKIAFTSNPTSRKRFDDNTIIFVDTINAKQVIERAKANLYLHTGSEPDILTGENGDICILQNVGYTDGTTFNMKKIESTIVVDYDTDENVHSSDNEEAFAAENGTVAFTIRDSYANRVLYRALANKRRN